jgi:hypothetical protein
MARIVALVALAFNGACAGLPVTAGTQARVPVGIWGGEHVALTVMDAGAHLEFDCASGDIEKPLELDAEGGLNVEGVFVQEHAGPVRVGQEPERKPARYAGRVEAKTMTLDVVIIESNEKVGTFTLTLDAVPRVRKCR